LSGLDAQDETAQKPPACAIRVVRIRMHIEHMAIVVVSGCIG
jgi:hypothetical protein